MWFLLWQPELRQDTMCISSCCLSLSLPVTSLSVFSLSLSLSLIILSVSLFVRLLLSRAFCKQPTFTVEVCCSAGQLLQLWQYSWELSRYAIIKFFSYSRKTLMCDPLPVILLLAQCLWKHWVCQWFISKNRNMWKRVLVGTRKCCQNEAHLGGSKGRECPNGKPGHVCHWGEIFWVTVMGWPSASQELNSNDLEVLLVVVICHRDLCLFRKQWT